MSNRNSTPAGLPTFNGDHIGFYRKVSQALTECFKRIYNLTNPAQLELTEVDFDISYAMTGVIADASNGAISINLPVLDSAEPRPYIIHKADGVNNVTINGEAINGGTSLVMSTQYETKIFIPARDYWTFL